jgi:hypothetical protein
LKNYTSGSGEVSRWGKIFPQRWPKEFYSEMRGYVGTYRCPKKVSILPVDNRHAFQGDNITLKRGTDPDYLLARLARDHRVPDPTELRFCRDLLNDYLSHKEYRHTSIGRPPGDYKQWARDCRQFKGDTKALAAHWGVTKDAVNKRKSVINYSRK